MLAQLAREVVDTLSLELFLVMLDGALSNLIQWNVSHDRDIGTGWSLKISSKPDHYMILWLYGAVVLFHHHKLLPVEKASYSINRGRRSNFLHGTLISGFVKGIILSYNGSSYCGDPFPDYFLKYYQPTKLLSFFSVLFALNRMHKLWHF